MPTPAGKPKVGETIEWYVAGELTDMGTVLRRTNGTTWEMLVEWTVGPTRYLVEAEYWRYRDQTKTGWKIQAPKF